MPGLPMVCVYQSLKTGTFSGLSISNLQSLPRANPSAWWPARGEIAHSIAGILPPSPKPRYFHDDESHIWDSRTMLNHQIHDATWIPMRSSY
jgi:hypothetical protein